MKTPAINLKDFDLENFLLGKRINLVSDEMNILNNACEHLVRYRQRICLKAPPGSGVENFFVRYKEKNPEQVFIVSCRSGSVNESFAHLMLELGFGHKTVNWFDTPVDNIVRALIYYLYKINARPLLIFDNCDSFKLPQLSNLLSELLRMKNETGLMFRITPNFADKIARSSDTQLRHCITQFDILEIQYSQPDELKKAVQENGIISNAVAEGIIKDTLDYDVICDRVDRLRSQVKAYLSEKGRK